MTHRLSPLECAERLKRYNEWRRGILDECEISPKEHGEMIDEVVDYLINYAQVPEREELKMLSKSAASLYRTVYLETMKDIEAAVHKSTWRLIKAAENVAKRAAKVSHDDGCKAT